MSRGYSSHAGLRLGLGVVLSGGWVVLAVVPLVLLWSRLPEPMATHWSLSGDPDASMSRLTVFTVQSGLSLLSAGFAFTWSRPSSTRSAARGAGFTIAVSTAAFFALLSALIVVANLDRPDWRQAAVTPLTLIPVVGGSALVALVMARLARTLGPPAATLPSEAATVGLRPSERATWVGRASSRCSLPVAGLSLPAGVATSVLSLNPAGAALVVMAGAITATFATVRVAVDRFGVRVAYGPLRWPSTCIEIDRIHRAAAVDVRPRSWGGWGYRGSLRLMGKAAVVVRAGQGLRLDLEGDRFFLVTVDDADVAAGLLNDQLRQAGGLDPH